MTQIAKLVSTDGQGETQDLEGCCFRYFITKSCLTLFVNPWTVTHQVSLSMGFPKQEYRSGLPFLSPGDLPNPGIEPESPENPAKKGGFFTTEPPGKPWLLNGNCPISSSCLPPHCSSMQVSQESNLLLPARKVLPSRPLCLSWAKLCYSVRTAWWDGRLPNSCPTVKSTA